jgi:hypothetical protein
MSNLITMIIFSIIGSGLLYFIMPNKIYEPIRKADIISPDVNREILRIKDYIKKINEITKLQILKNKAMKKTIEIVIPEGYEQCAPVSCLYASREDRLKGIYRQEIVFKKTELKKDFN